MRAGFWDIQEDMEDYFDVNENIVEGMYILADMFFDNRTIEMEEDELQQLFYSHGYYWTNTSKNKKLSNH